MHAEGARLEPWVPGSQLLCNATLLYKAIDRCQNGLRDSLVFLITFQVVASDPAISLATPVTPLQFVVDSICSVLMMLTTGHDCFRYDL